MGLVFLEEQNVFDQMYHLYLFRVWEKLGLGTGFVSYILLLHKQIQYIQ